MVFPCYTSWPSQPPNPNSISINFFPQAHPHAMEPSSSSSSAPQFHLDFNQSRHLPHQQNSPSPRSLLGPRPPPLKVNKNSQKIKKPPTGPAAAAARAPAPPPRLQPVIIYTVSPKVIRTKPGNFMSLVQRLTGINSSPTAVETALAANSPPAFPSPGGAPSPAARLAAIEQAQKLPNYAFKQRPSVEELTMTEQLDPAAAALNHPACSAGILTPNPALLQPVSPYLFSPPAALPELNSLGFLQDMLSHMSPAPGAGRGFLDGSYLLSPLGFSMTPTAPSPVWDFLMSSPQRNLDFFNTFPDM